MAIRPPFRRQLRVTAPAIPETLEVAGALLPVTVRRHPRARRLILRLAPGGVGVVVTAPGSAPPASIAAFLDRHRGWVEGKLKTVRRPTVVAPGTLLPLRGEDILLAADPALRSVRLLPAGEGRSRATLAVGGAPEHFSRRLVDFLKREARRDLQAAVDRHAAAVGLKPAAMTLKDTRSRWGSCTADRRLAFSWRIVMAPPEVLDYLAAHEVAHFREMNHGPGFWALCGELCPEMDFGRHWLKRHGGGLHAVAFDYP